MKELENEVNESTNGTSYSHAKEVKKLLIDAIANGTSVLLKDKKAGTNYAANPESNTVYTGLNQLVLQQSMENNGFENPYFVTTDQARAKGRFPKNLSLNTTISYYCPEGVRYDFDVYPIKDGKYDKSVEPIHRKGDVKKDTDGKVIIGYEYKPMYNLEQLGTFQYRENAQVDENGKKVSWVEVEDPYALKPRSEIHLPIPFQGKNFKFDPSKPTFYKAKDDSALEVFAEQASKFLHSCYSDNYEYKAWKPTPEQIKSLQSEIDNEKSLFFQKVNDASFQAIGRNDIQERVNENRQKKLQNAQKENTASIAM